LKKPFDPPAAFGNYTPLIAQAAGRAEYRNGQMLTSDFDFELPPELIAQEPASRRDDSRLLVLNRASGNIEHRRFRNVIESLRPGEVLVLNNSRVIPARLRACNARTGGKFEILLLEQNAVNDWWCLVRPGKRARTGVQLLLRDARDCGTGLRAEVREVNSEGHRRLCFSGTPDIGAMLDVFGEVPLPPYIHRAGGPTDQDKERYQTVFAQPLGSVAAPTAGLHFTDDLLNAIRSLGVLVCFVTLHVGPGTFRPVQTETIEGHTMHEERYELTAQTAQTINQALETGRRIVAVGTTTVRVLESVADAHGGRLAPGAGRTRIFLHPPRRFRVAGAMLTNFHLPCSTLLMLVSAFAAPGETRGREMILSAYAEAVRERYRFFSYGDAMLIV
jgi:S-adenosylmethionine:tRNA ribosyltransferase-isomerase